jgi:hypothetical protein
LRHIGREIRLAARLYGFLDRQVLDGASVPRARAPMVSITRFTCEREDVCMCESVYVDVREFEYVVIYISSCVLSLRWLMMT